VGTLGQNIYIRPLMARPDLALRQLRIMTGLLRDGLSKEEIQGLQWYDKSLEVYYPGEAVNTHTPVNTEDVNTPEDKRREYMKKYMAKKRAKE
jgi:hypothetical protein